jgi:hypothetical protein
MPNPRQAAHHECAALIFRRDVRMDARAVTARDRHAVLLNLRREGCGAVRRRAGLQEHRDAARVFDRKLVLDGTPKIKPGRAELARRFGGFVGARMRCTVGYDVDDFPAKRLRANFS